MNTKYLYKEIEALRLIDHPHIIKLETYFQIESDYLALLLEYARGGTLKEHIKEKGKMQEYEVRDIMRQILNTLNYLHVKEIIHRDLKLENLVFEDSSRKVLKIIDFGIAGLFENDHSKAGSLSYIAPEVICGLSLASKPSIDVWSMGCILFELLTGEKLFKGSREDIKVRDFKFSGKF